MIEAIKAGLPLPEPKPEWTADAEGSPAGSARGRRRAAAAPAPEHRRHLPVEGGGVGCRAPARGHASGSLGDPPGPHRIDRADSRGGPVGIELKGNLAAMPAAAQKTKRSPKQATFWCRFNWLRGAGNRRFCSSGAGRRDAGVPPICRVIACNRVAYLPRARARNSRNASGAFRLAGKFRGAR